MKTISSGIIITDARYVLAGHGTGKPIRNGYDIFKGKKDQKTEKYIDTALRELYEESSIVLNRHDLMYAGKFEYLYNKNLKLWVYRSKNVKKEFPLVDLKCLSVTPNSDYEMDHYRYIAVDKLQVFLYKSLYPIVFEIVHGLPKGISW